MLDLQLFRKKTLWVCVGILLVTSAAAFAGEIGIREDGSVIYTKDDGTWILVIPTEYTVRIALNKRDHELWSHPVVKKRLKGRDPEELSSREAKKLLEEVREGGLEKYEEDLKTMAKTVREMAGLKDDEKEGKDDEKISSTEEEEKKQSKTISSPKQLQQKVNLPFDDMPFSDVIAFLKEITSLDYRYDKNILPVDGGLITIDYQGPLHKALDRICDQVDLKWKADKEGTIHMRPKK